MFKWEKGPPQFTRLLNLWIQFESQEHSTDSSKFGALQCPQAVYDWIAQGCLPTFCLQKVPKGVDLVTEFEGKSWAWWASLQPQGQPRDGTLLERDEEGCPSRVFKGDWGTLHLPGANGWSSVIAAICFWSWRLKEMKTDGYRVAAAAERAQQSWNHALDDVKWVLSHLV
ncbi:uncharacterized protein ARMOST_11667 [Armillaria ostoyae]|uniref:Uncharacterized protein n=1 Tax=Armillaria ostoyae TaxID=47428 RepID=A0A284RHS1_ARMOS|nr:uncharacterized protein ARMOST_11667 [Armillaria ostoyae]